MVRGYVREVTRNRDRLDGELDRVWGARLPRVSYLGETFTIIGTIADQYGRCERCDLRARLGNGLCRECWDGVA